METHGYHYLRSVRSSVEDQKPSEAQEQAMIQALADFVKLHDKHVAFLRIDTWTEQGHLPRAVPPVPLTTRPWCLTSPAETRRCSTHEEARQALMCARRCAKAPAEVADETAQATAGLRRLLRGDGGDRQSAMDCHRRPMSDYTV